MEEKIHNWKLVSMIIFKWFASATGGFEKDYLVNAKGCFKRVISK